MACLFIALQVAYCFVSAYLLMFWDSMCLGFYVILCVWYLCVVSFDDSMLAIFCVCYLLMGFDVGYLLTTLGITCQLIFSMLSFVCAIF